MLKTLTSLVAVVALAASLAAQDKKPVTVADFVGTWNIEVMSHQVALVIEPAESNKVTATMMMMGNDVPLKGELVDRTLTLSGVRTEGAAATAPPVAPHVAHQPPALKPITVTMQDDGTVAGEMMTNQGPVKWTGAKLKKKN